MMFSLVFSSGGRQRFILWLVLLALGASRTSAQRPLGTDVSHYQTTINWTTVKNAGVTFAWTKATEGTSYTDPYFVTHTTGAKGVGIYIGAYHFARPSQNPNLTGTNSADSEAAFFWNVASNYVRPASGYLVPMLDWEDVNMTNQLSAATLSAWVNQWCNSVSNYARLNGATNVRPVVYTGTWYSRPSTNYSGLTTAVTNWPSWIAAYPLNPNPQSGGPSDAYPWATWNFWQYADTNWSGGDADVFNGPLAGLGTYVIGGLSSAPFVTSQPSSRYADRSGALTFTAAADGAAPLQYQWRFNGLNLADATNAALTLANIQTNHAGNYTLFVTNLAGSVTSSVATLTVNPLYTPVFADDFDANSASNWTLNQSSPDTRATFAYDYSGIGLPSAPHSGSGTTKGLRLDANLTGGAIAAVSVSPAGQSFFGDYRLHFDMWINVNGPLPGGGTGSTEALTAGVGTTGTQVQWNGPGSTANGVWFEVDGEGGVSDTSTTQGDFVAYVGATAQATSSGVYLAGSSTTVRGNSDPYYANVFPAGQTPPPTQIAAYPQQTGALNAGTVGFAWRDVVVNKSGSTVEWFIDGLKIASVSGAAITASNIFVGYWDPFASLSDNTNLSFGVVDNLRVEVPAVAPSVSVQPLAVAVKVASNASFSVVATGTPAPTYQWRFNGTNLAGATLPNYARNTVQYSQAGNYSVLLSNIAGTVVSSNALLTILPAAPAQFVGPTLQPDGSLAVTLSGDVGATYFVETSTNLLNWSAATNIALVGPAMQFNLGAPTNDMQRYFRARSAP